MSTRKASREQNLPTYVQTCVTDNEGRHVCVQTCVQTTWVGMYVVQTMRVDNEGRHVYRHARTHLCQCRGRSFNPTVPWAWGRNGGKDFLRATGQPPLEARGDGSPQQPIAIHTRLYTHPYTHLYTRLYTRPYMHVYIIQMMRWIEN